MKLVGVWSWFIQSFVPLGIFAISAQMYPNTGLWWALVPLIAWCVANFLCWRGLLRDPAAAAKPVEPVPFENLSPADRTQMLNRLPNGQYIAPVVRYLETAAADKARYVADVTVTIAQRGDVPTDLATMMAQLGISGKEMQLAAAAAEQKAKAEMAAFAAKVASDKELAQIRSQSDLEKAERKHAVAQAELSRQYAKELKRLGDDCAAWLERVPTAVS